MQRAWFLILLLLASSSFAQETLTTVDQGYFKKMNNTLNLRLDLDNDVRSFEFSNFESELQESYSILPNTRARLAIAYNYRFLSFRIGFSPKFLAKDDASEKGNTNIFQLTLDMYIDDFAQTFDFNRTKGYYVDGTDDPLLPYFQLDGEYILLPNLKSLSITGTTWYRFNENYSFKAIINQTEVQTQSAGSFVPGLHYGYFEITDNTGPQDIKSWFVIANAGYFHTFVLGENWYSNLGIAPGLGFEFVQRITRTDEEEISTRHNNFSFSMNAQMSLGYNSDRFYAGTSLFGSAIGRDEEAVIKFNNVRGYFKIYVGYRFDPPRALIKAMDWVESKNPFKKN